MNSNKLIEIQVMAEELESVVRLITSMWQDVRGGVEQQRLSNALLALSLSSGLS
ncbi:hypothetical protein [Pseudomonas putida]|uniref:Uncharacterized protein n=1 Tax=Pseudomonas putida TaxID=303 RepID=A0A6I7EPJ6_PSEPU|nr:hypothetical protein [Pseudomonas putida]QHW08404.1 hypothetical protein C2H86_28595 [Pseudomonas putida]